MVDEKQPTVRINNSPYIHKLGQNVNSIISQFPSPHHPRYRILNFTYKHQYQMGPPIWSLLICKYCINIFWINGLNMYTTLYRIWLWMTYCCQNSACIEKLYQLRCTISKSVCVCVCTFECTPLNMDYIFIIFKVGCVADFSDIRRAFVATQNKFEVNVNVIYVRRCCTCLAHTRRRILCEGRRGCAIDLRGFRNIQKQLQQHTKEKCSTVCII